MSDELSKKEIKGLVDALREYGINNSLPQELLAKGSGVNVSYINAMLSGKYIVGKTLIADHYYRKVAEYIGYDLEKVYWVHRDIDEYQEMYVELMDAKVNGNMKIIINNSGYGKTYTMERFIKENRLYSYHITVSSLHNISDILEEIGTPLGIDLRKGKVARLKQIAAKFRQIRLGGRKPILIIDEMENAKIATLKMIKALYDAISKYCPIVLIGTDDLILNINKLLESKEPGIRQFFRRFKSGIHVIKNRAKEEIFEPFLQVVEDKKLRELLCNICDNIGELHDYLEPALRMADQMGELLTMEFFLQLKSNNIN